MQPFITVSQVFTDLEDVEMRVMSWNPPIFSDISDGSIYGQPCAASAISVAAFDIEVRKGLAASRSRSFSWTKSESCQY